MQELIAVTDKGDLCGGVAEIPEMHCTILVSTSDEVGPRIR